MLWGDGSPMREFLYADDLADAALYLMENKNYQDIGEFVNVGVGKDITIKDLALLIADIVGYEGNIQWDTSKPNGMPRKLLDVGKLRDLGWQAECGLREGIERAYRDFVRQT
jgi:GDP-L-fucose synthase